MDSTWIEVVDTAIKIGLGAIVAGMSGYLALIKSQSHEVEKEHRVRYFDLQEEKKKKYVEFLTQSQILIQTHIHKIANLESESFLTYIKTFNEIQILVEDKLRKASYDIFSSVTIFIISSKTNQNEELFNELKSDALEKIGYFQKLAQADVTHTKT